MRKIKQIIQTILPKSVYNYLIPKYHFGLALLASIYYRWPSRKITVIGVTGTKGKSSVTEILGHILREDGKTVATLSTIKFTLGNKTERNLFKMTMPGRFYIQKFLRQAVDTGCTHAVIEMTSEGARLHRHRFIAIDALVFTNLTPEHIESHGSFAAYKQAKLSIAKAVARSSKRPRYLVANVDDEHGQDFLDFAVEWPLPYSLKDLSLYTIHKDSMTLVVDGRNIRVPLVGLFNVYNVLASIKMAQALDVPLENIQEALEKLPVISGRVEKFYSPEGSGRAVTAVVDYAHTPDSLTQLYEAFKDQTKVCVLGNTGGGRDTWKRPEMAAIAEKYCDFIILTNEDPYDEDPQKIIDDMAGGIEDKNKLKIEIDRRKAIEAAIAMTPHEGVAIISGKGTDPYIMGPNGTKQSWSDAETVKDVLLKTDFGPAETSEE